MRSMIFVSDGTLSQRNLGQGQGGFFDVTPDLAKLLALCFGIPVGLTT